MTTGMQIATTMKVGCYLYAYLAVCAMFPEGAINKDFNERIQTFLNDESPAFFQPGAGRGQKYWSKVRYTSGLGQLVEQLRAGGKYVFPHKYKLTFLGLLVCERLFGVLHPIFDPSTGIIARLRKLIDEHEDNPQMVRVVNVAIDLTNED
jgi:hypothetical protein